MKDIPVLYEDNHLLIVEKPINIPVQLDRSQDLDLLTLLKEKIKRRDRKPGNVYLALVHRLDRPVGGAIVFAKTSKAASRMADQLRKREIKRTYLAVVRGSLEQDSGKLVHFLKKDHRRNMVNVVEAGVKGGKKAILRYEVLDRKDDLTLVKIDLETGRSHQIRVQFQAIGHPLYGDQKYGQTVNKIGQQIALWSHQLTFIHPVRKEVLSVSSHPPFLSIWQDWKIKNR